VASGQLPVASKDRLLIVARGFAVVVCVLAISLDWPWWVMTIAGGLTLGLFCVTPLSRRAYVCGRDDSRATDIPHGGQKVLVMTEREANQRNAALVANGREEYLE